MTEQINPELLSELFAQIERAWLDDGDRKLVYKLSEKYPHLREQLYEFFEDLVIEPERDPTVEMIKAEDRVNHWLRSSGINIAMAAAAQARSLTTSSEALADSSCSPSEKPGKQQRGHVGPKARAANWLVFLRERTKQTLPDLTRPLQHVTTEYLVLLSRHPNIVPLGVKTQIARDVERVWGVSAHESFHYFAQQSSVVRAASRSRPFEKEPQTFDELLDRSALTADQKAFWRQYASPPE